MSLRVAAIALVGNDLDGLETILREWLSGEHRAGDPLVDLANDLLDKIADPLEVDPA